MEFVDIPSEPICFTLPLEYYGVQVNTSEIYKNVKINMCNNFHFQIQDNTCMVPCICNSMEGCGRNCQNRMLFM